MACFKFAREVISTEKFYRRNFVNTIDKKNRENDSKKNSSRYLFAAEKKSWETSKNFLKLIFEMSITCPK
jgi:hypothetical protein